MQLRYVTPHASISGQVSDEEVPSLVVISGPNGAGKTHLLEAISNHHVHVIEGDQKVGAKRDDHSIRYFPFGSLQAIAGRVSSGSAEGRWRKQVSDAIGLSNNQNPFAALVAGEESIGAAAKRLADMGFLSRSAIEMIEETAGKKLGEMTLGEISVFAPALSVQDDPFTSSITDIFMTYQTRLNSHRHRQWLYEMGKSTSTNFLTDEQFFERFGEAPWDLLNRTLQLIGLPYQFVLPDNFEMSWLEPTLVDGVRGHAVPVASLSTGEKTLLAIALGLYASELDDAAASLPRVLLLDEPDASLHPTMVDDMLRVLQDVMVDVRGVKVVMTTHSPTTVALAPEASIYVLERSETPRLHKRTRDEALKALTVGLPTLSVSAENRRQVFVESKFDEAIYSELFTTLRSSVDGPFSLEFVAVGHSRGGGCAPILRLVPELRERGNDRIFGMVDRDSGKQATEGVVFDTQFYAVENMVLNPLSVGLLLMRDDVIKGSDIGASDDIRHFAINSELLQPLVDHVVEFVTPRGSQAPSDTVLSSGANVQVPEWMKDIRGHDLEDALLEDIAPLRRYKNQLVMSICTSVIKDRPDLVPAAVLDVFASIGRDGLS